MAGDQETGRDPGVATADSEVAAAGPEQGARGAVVRKPPIEWMSTRDACERLGVTLRTLYRFIDEGQLTAYKMGRVIRLQGDDVEAFIDRMRIEPGTLEHLYPEPKGHDRPDHGD